MSSHNVLRLDELRQVERQRWTRLHGLEGAQILEVSVREGIWEPFATLFADNTLALVQYSEQYQVYHFLHGRQVLFLRRG